MQNHITDIFYFSVAAFKRFLLIVLMGAAVTLFSAENAKKRDVRIGVLADRGIKQCVKQWTPTADYLTENIPGYTFYIVPLTFNDAVTQVKNRKLDFMLVNPGVYIDLESKYGAVRIATLMKQHNGKGCSLFGGVIITRSDRSDIKNASDLKGKTFAAPAPNSFVAWNAICRELLDYGINPWKDFRKIEYLGSHDLVIQAVKNGEVDAGSIRSEVLELLADAGKIKLDDFRVLYPKKITPEFPFTRSTRLYPEWLLAKFPGTSVDLVKKVAAVLLYMSHDRSAAKSANLTGWTIPANYESVRDCLKAVKSPPYEHYGEVTFTQALRQHWVFFTIIFFLLISVIFLAVHLFQRNMQLLKSTEIIRDKEKKLRKERDKIKEILTVMPDNICIIGTEYDIQYVNPLILNTFGEIKGRKCYEYLHGLSSPCPNCTINKVIDGKSTECEWTALNNNRIFDVFNTPYNNSDGSVALLAIMRDITDRKHAQENLKATLNSIGDAVISADRDGTILWMNPAAEEMAGLKSSEAKGNHYNTVLSALNTVSGGSVVEQIKDKLLSSDIVSFDEPITLQSKSGEELKIAIASTPMKDDAGNATGIIFVLRDITRELKAMEMLEKVERLNSIGTLAGGIAHDFNNILTAIFGNISIAKVKLQEDHPAYRFINDAEKSISRATSLTLQLLTFAKGGEPVKEDVNLCKIIDEIVHFDLAGSNVKPIINVADDLWNANVDKGQIQQVFSNLTINANQAMPDGGHIYVTLENAPVENGEVANLAPGRYIRATVRDEGTGIDEKHINAVFDPYFTTKKTGNGLGLATTYSIMVKHGGMISVKSEVGKGTTFTLYITASDTKSTAESPPADEDKKETQKVKNRRILVMDDEEVILKLVEAVLGDIGYSVVTAQNGTEALEEYRHSITEGKVFDAVIMDLTVPGEKGGKEIVGEILKIDPNAKCIVSSGYADDPAVVNYAEYGFVGTVSKPFCIKKLLEVIEKVLTKKAS